jgi:hypothetical protein
VINANDQGTIAGNVLKMSGSNPQIQSTNNLNINTPLNMGNNPINFTNSGSSGLFWSNGDNIYDNGNLFLTSNSNMWVQLPGGGGMFVGDSAVNNLSVAIYPNNGSGNQDLFHVCQDKNCSYSNHQDYFYVSTHNGSGNSNGSF